MPELPAVEVVRRGAGDGAEHALVARVHDLVAGGAVVDPLPVKEQADAGIGGGGRPARPGDLGGRGRRRRLRGRREDRVERNGGEVVRRSDGRRLAFMPDAMDVEFDAVVRSDTPGEADYYRNGGILQYVLRKMLRS